MARLGLEREGEACEQSGIRFQTFPIVDRSVPEFESPAEKLVDQINADWESGQNINIPCRQGIGRAAPGRISRARGVPVPETRQQRDWVDRFAEILAKFR